MANDVGRVIRVSLWTDERVLNEFTPEDRYFWLYLLTNPYTTQLGIYALPTRIAALQLGYSNESVISLLQRFESRYNLIRVSEESGEIAIKNFLRHSIIKGGKPVYDCLMKEANLVKDEKLLEWVFENVIDYYNRHPGTTNLTVLEFIRDSKNQLSLSFNENDNDNDNENDNERIVNESSKSPKTQRKTAFKVPTLEEVRMYCEERKNGIDAQHFIDFYTSKGWMIGKNRMKDWKAAVRTWEKNRKADNRAKKSDKPEFDLEAWANE